ncbi:MAG TPA: hypothetical protein VFX97_03540 [Pyrinomonadaceae bacterium]|nr:hypothetical protein [Pyrinomonadaceae bacterium]
MLVRHIATRRQFGNSGSTQQGSTNGKTFATKALGTRAGIIEDWRAGGDKRTGRKLNRNGFRDGR